MQLVIQRLTVEGSSFMACLRVPVKTGKFLYVEIVFVEGASAAAAPDAWAADSPVPTPKGLRSPLQGVACEVVAG